MGQKILKYNRNKKQFNLDLGSSHFVYRKTRAEEVREMDDWLINNEPVENRAYITFEDNQGNKYAQVPIKTSGLYCWYDVDKHDNPKWESYLWEIPTSKGIVFIQPKNGIAKLYQGEHTHNQYADAVKIKPQKIVISYSK